MKGEGVEKEEDEVKQEEEVKVIKKYWILLSSHYFKCFICISFHKLSNNIVVGRIEYWSQRCPHSNSRYVNLCQVTWQKRFTDIIELGILR